MNIDNRFFKTPANNIKFLETQVFLGVRRVSNLNFSNEKNKNYGFSLIEMIVVVAIMAVMVVVLAPSLLMYNERSRAEKDNASMDELVNAVQLALADSEVYDEVLRFSTVDNVSCYVDTNSESNYSRIVTKENPNGIDQYTFLSDARTLDETPYFAAGNMRGVTLTFAPDKGSNSSTFDLKQGVVNQYIQVSNNQRIGAMPKLYNAVRSTIGDTIVSDSQTYRNSEYTIFVRLGTTGGNDASQQDAIQAYGQWSGTNLPAQVSYQIVSDRIVGDIGNQIVEINDNKWNETNGSKLTLKPGDLNGGGSFDASTSTGNSKIKAKEIGKIYAYLTYDNTLILRETPRENTGDISKEFGELPVNNSNNWGRYAAIITKVNIETPISPISCSAWFFSCKQLKTIENIKNLDTENVTKMDRMFYNCSKLTELDVSDWDTSNVTDMHWMFSNCGNLTELDVSNWNMINVNDIESMFSQCKKLTKLNVSDWNTANVINMSDSFSQCSNLTELDVSNWNTSNASDMSNMFSRCYNLIKLDLSNWNTANVTNIGSMFEYCDNLIEIDISNWNTSNISTATLMFCSCENLTSIGNIEKINEWDISNLKYKDSMFSGCLSLKELPSWY